MRITYLGHAGFCVEDAQNVIIMDPWLSPSGAFDSAWFQFPRNHHLARFVCERLADPTRERYVYISHEHQDHFDLEFLRSLSGRDFTLVLPHFRNASLLSKLSGYRCRRLAALLHREEVALQEGMIRLYLDDSELNRDSAALLRLGDRVFFNLNDCKLFDRLDEVRTDTPEIHVFACQFSGATWHPTCYQYETQLYQTVSKRKMFTKFESVARAIETLEPKTYLPSAGPACFLDPDLYHLNLEPVNIFPSAAKLEAYLNRRLSRVSPDISRLMPGDELDARTGAVIRRSELVDADEQYTQYLQEYAASYRDFFQQRARFGRQVDANAQLLRLRHALERKLQHLPLAERVNVPFYFRFTEIPERAVKVNFPMRSVRIVEEAVSAPFYELRAPAWQIAQVLDGDLSWEEFSLTFRARIRRDPDTYQPVLHAFLLLDDEELTKWCDMMLELESNRERIVVQCGEQEYSILRYCPHQGGDLAQGWIEDGRYLVCPRHRWHFDLTQDGHCTSNASSIDAQCVERERN
jgi:UDP-MurNAc hydroxylase